MPVRSERQQWKCDRSTKVTSWVKSLWPYIDTIKDVQLHTNYVMRLKTTFDGILDNLAGQFNSHYDIEESITESQTQLDAEQRADIDVRTKAGELIGRLSAVLWIYNNGNDVHIIFMSSKVFRKKLFLSG